MEQAERQALIGRYREGYGMVTAALDGITDGELDVRIAPDEWTVREIVHHLADSELHAAIRLRRLLAEEQPLIVAYDEQTYTQRAHYERPIGISLQTFRAVRQANAELLDQLTESDWLREGTHNESGRYTVEGWPATYAAHAETHAAQIRRVRAHSA